MNQSSFPQYIFDRLKNRSITYDDVMIIIKEIHNMTYYEFSLFMEKNVNMSYIVNISLKAWYTKLTKKCNFCNKLMNITQYTAEKQRYNCIKCKILHDFDNYDIDEYVIYKFMDLLNCDN